VLPKGDWHNFWTGETLEGGSELSVPAITDRIPVYVKSGSIVPWADVGLFAGAPETRKLVARVYGDGTRSIVLGKRENTLRLSWSSGQGRAEGKRLPGGYDVYNWKHFA
jgi:alpha-glucosidase (family GH31 glycosyl hydrolase)